MTERRRQEQDQRRARGRQGEARRALRRRRRRRGRTSSDGTTGAAAAARAQERAGARAATPATAASGAEGRGRCVYVYGVAARRPRAATAARGRRRRARRCASSRRRARRARQRRAGDPARRGRARRDGALPGPAGAGRDLDDRAADAVRHRHARRGAVRDDLLERSRRALRALLDALDGPRRSSTSRCLPRGRAAARGPRARIRSSRVRTRAASGRPEPDHHERIALGEAIAARGRGRARRASIEQIAATRSPSSPSTPTSASRATSDMLANAAFLVEREPRRRVRRGGRAPRRASRSGSRFRYVGPAAALLASCDLALDGDGGMGLITGLLTLPLAPVRGVVWVAEQLARGGRARARRARSRPSAQLAELEAARERRRDLRRGSSSGARTSCSNA